MQEYYRAIRASLAVVPAFASDIYYTKKASSSVAAALIVGTPLLADEQLLKHYTYLSKVASRRCSLLCAAPLLPARPHGLRGLSLQLLPQPRAASRGPCCNFLLL